MQSAGGKSLVRKVSMEPKFKQKKRVRRLPSTGLQRYLSTRGTAMGIHEFTRATRFRIGQTFNGFQVGASQGNGFSMIFLPGAAFLNISGASTSASISNYAELAALFDEIKIDRIDVEFISTNQSNAITVAPVNATTNTSQGCLLQTCIDYNVTGVPATEGSIQEYGSYQQTFLDAGKVHRRSFRPKYQVGVVNSGGGIIGTESRQGYFASANNVEHQGLAGWVVGASQITPLDIICTYHYKCKVTK